MSDDIKPKEITKELTIVREPEEFFRELVTDALGKQRVRTIPETEVYLVNLLRQFMKSEELARQEPLALLVKEALEKPSVEEQKTVFRYLGDISLYTAGFFQDSLNRKLVDVDYYIEVGGGAYRQVAARSSELLHREVYGELAQKFASFVDVLAHVSDKTQIQTEKDVLRLYEVWIKTRSERAAKALQEVGIIPNKTVTKNIQ